MPIHPAFEVGHIKELLIRKEWEVTLEQVHKEEREGTNNFIVIGHPGIGMCTLLTLVPLVRNSNYSITGKTLSLFYFLARCVALGLPTFFQDRPNQLWFFDEKGVDHVRYQDVLSWRDLVGSNYVGAPIWALVDSSTIPDDVLWWGTSPFFVVQAASPRERHWAWTKHHRLTTVFYTKPFSLQELLHGVYASVSFQRVAYRLKGIRFRK